MDEIKPITENRLRFLAGDKKFGLYYLEKDYYLTALLYFLKDTPGLCFKGGTALNKIFLNHRRLSEDIDFTCTGQLEKTKKAVLEVVENKKEFFEGTEFGKQTPGFFRLKITYKTITGMRPEIVIDVNSRATVWLKPKKYEIPHFYAEIPKFTVLTLDEKELIAEKVAATVQRNAPRDYYDIYNIINKKMPIDKALVKKKLKEHGGKFDIGRIFRRGNKVYARWETDLLPLTKTKPDYKKVIRTIAKHFRYKQGKK